MGMYKRDNGNGLSISKTKAPRRSPCYEEERLFLALALRASSFLQGIARASSALLLLRASVLGCWLGRLFRRSLLLVGTLVELSCNHDDSGVLHAILVCPLLWLEEALDGEQRAFCELVE